MTNKPKVELHLGDCLEVLATLPENSIDTCITDPPYELGFMGKKWDSSGIAFQPETWQAVYRVLKPGALLLAFGGTRTYHRMVCAIEDAGFEIRDMVEWVYGSGFPKSYDIGKGIDKQAGAEREVVGKYELPDVSDGLRKKGWECTNKTEIGIFGVSGQNTITAPSTPEAQLWDGWGTALKPAHEPIVVAMKPIDGNFVNNALTWGVAGYWIDGGRIPGEPIPINKLEEWSGFGQKIKPEYKQEINNIGRFPANLIHDGSDEVLEVFPECKQANDVSEFRQLEPMRFSAGGEGVKPQKQTNGKIITASASRFFYCAKASRAERNAGLENNGHPTVKPIALMRYLVRLTKTPTGGVVLDPFMGSGTTGIACELEGRDFIGIEREPEYIEIAERRIAKAQLQERLEFDD